MKKIMFDDRFGLTQAVLDGRKTMTRRIVPDRMLEAYYDYDDYVLAVAPSDIPYSRDYEEEFFLRRSPYKPGEVVAVAQCYKDAIQTDGLPHPLVARPGWTNKMFVKADLMPYRIRITNVRIERLQDISDEDCMREGIFEKSSFPHKKSYPFYFGGGKHGWDNSFHTPRKAFAALLDKISGRGTWESNPFVFAYEFELVK